MFALLSLSILRFFLFILYLDDFADLSFLEILVSFLMGVRVDIVSLCMIFALPTFLLFLPLKIIEYKRVQVGIYFLLYIFISIVIFVIVADMVYFEHVHRHITNEITAMQNDIHIVFDMINLHFVKVIYFVIFELILFYFFKKIIDFNIKSSFNLKNVALLLCVVIFFVFGIRNSIASKPFGLSDAFTTNKTSSGNLAINGFFSLSKSFKKQTIYHFFDEKIATKYVKNTLKSKDFNFIDEKYPILRQAKNTIAKKHNVVIVLLESWSSKYIDSFSNNNLGVTKNFDKIANNGLKFTNFFANGQRSIEGITALFTGIPILPGFNYLGKGLELSNFSYLGNSAKNAGYSTMAMQSSKRNSFRIDSIAKLAGFDKFYGKEDIPDLGLERKDAKPRFGTWDNNMLSFYLKKINTLEEPFLSFAFTSTTHIPFVSPGKKWEKYKHDENNILGFLNTLNYADEALGNFMEKAKRQKWFDNTIFIFMADHTVGFGRNKELLENTNIKIKNDRALENMRIPLVFYAPKIFTQAKSIGKLSSQADILPTLSDYLGWKTPIATASNSIFSTSSNPFVLFTNGNILGFVSNEGFIKHNLKNTLENNLGNEGMKKILSFYQILSNGIRNNKIAP